MNEDSKKALATLPVYNSYTTLIQYPTTGLGLGTSYLPFSTGGTRTIGIGETGASAKAARAIIAEL